MSGDYKLEIMAPKGYWETVESYESQRAARQEIRRRQESGEWDRCAFYIVNKRTGWRSCEVTPMKSGER